MSTGPAVPTAVRHVDFKTQSDEQRVEARQVLANCAPNVLARMLPDAERAKIEEAYGARPLSISLFSAHFGLSRRPAELGLDRFSLGVMPEWAKTLNDHADGARLLWRIQATGCPAYGITNYGAIDSGLAEGGPTLVSVVGVDRFDNWSALSPQDEKDRRERWLDAFQAALERDYPGFGAAVVRAHVPQRPLDGELHEHAARRGVWFRAAAVRSLDLVGRPALAEDAAARGLSRLVFRPVRRLQRRDAVWRRRRADGDAGARGVSARILCPCQSPCPGRRPPTRPSFPTRPRPDGGAGRARGRRARPAPSPAAPR